MSMRTVIQFVKHGQHACLKSPIIDRFNEGYCRWSPDRRLLSANSAFLKMMEIVLPDGQDFPAHVDSFTFHEMCGQIETWLAERGEYTVDDHRIHLARKSGGFLWLSVDARRAAIGDDVYYDACVSDITSLREHEKALNRQTFYDPVTNLPNRALFEDYLRSAIDECRRRPETRFAVISLNIRHFGDINRHYGRGFGDMLLRYAGEIIRRCCRESDQVARTDTNAYAALLRNVAGAGQIISVIKRIRAALGTSFHACGQTLNGVNVDVGVLLSLAEYFSPEKILRDVEIATNRASLSRKGNGCKFFSSRMLHETKRDLALTILLQDTRGLEGFYLDYQPIIRQNDGSLHSFEALARWRHEGEKIPPSVFIPIAERTGFILRLGTFVMEETCRQLRKWQTEFGRNVEVHVNISPYQLFMNSFPDIVRNVLIETQVDARGLLFEVTESALLDDFDLVLFNINEIRKLGVRFCLDDFGTGYSSLSYLKHLPIDYLKIDRTFVLDVEKDARTRKLLEHIVSIGRDMGYDLIVEGVESDAQLELLKDYKQLLIQGYYFHKPLDVASARELLSNSARLSPAEQGGVP